MSRINDNIKKRLEEIGLTQIELADKINEEAKKDGVILNVTNKLISSWIRNITRPDIDILKYVCLALGVDANYLYDFEEKQEKKSRAMALKEALEENGFFDEDEDDISQETLDKLLDFVDRNADFLTNNGTITIDTMVDFIKANKSLIPKQ